MNTAKPMYEWNTIPWRKLERNVFKLEQRIYQASLRGERQKLRKLQGGVASPLLANIALLGFNFLGFNVRQYKVSKYNSGKRHKGFKTIIKPSQESIQRHIDAIRKVLDKGKPLPQSAIIKELNPIIRFAPR